MSKSRYENIAAAVYGSTWAIMPEKLQAIVDVVQARVEGKTLDWSADQAALAAAESRGEGRRVSKVAILPLFGTISNRMNMLTAFSGGTSAEKFGRMFDEAIADDAVTAIVLDTDSPGGVVAGTPELAAKIFNARGKKPIVAVVNSMMASAAFWIGSAADEVVITPSGQIGSVGVIAIHTETSKADRKAGIKTTLVYEGEFKAEGNPYEPLSDEACGAIKTRLAHYYTMFTDALAAHRGLSAQEVKDRFGRGRVVIAGDAVERGMADRVATLETVLGELLSGDYRPTRSTAKAVHDSDNDKSFIQGKDTPMGKEDKPALTVEQLKAENPQIHQAVFEAGQAAGKQLELNRFAALQKACGDDTALAAECFAAGLTVVDALTKRNEKLCAQLKAASEKPPAAADPVAKATLEFKEQPTPKDQVQQFDESKATDEELKAHFAATPELRDRFSSAQAYVAHVRHPPRK